MRWIRFSDCDAPEPVLSDATSAFSVPDLGCVDWSTPPGGNTEDAEGGTGELVPGSLA